MKTIYAIPNFECNLSCPHCDIHLMESNYDETKFISQLEKIDFNDNVILFGGEPTLFKDRVLKCINTGKIKSISTNLINIDYELLNAFIANRISITSSWNLQRFPTRQIYDKWLDSLRKLAHLKIKISVLVTMTQGLIEKDIDSILCKFKEIEDTNAVESILFEHYIGDDVPKIHNSNCDAWLCRLHDKWNLSLKNKIEEKINDWSFVCKDTYTLFPNGKLVNRCPHGLKQHFFIRMLKLQIF